MAQWSTKHNLVEDVQGPELTEKLLQSVADVAAQLQGHLVEQSEKVEEQLAGLGLIASQQHVLGERLAELAVQRPQEPVVGRVEVVVDRVDHESGEERQLLAVELERSQLRGDALEEGLDLGEDGENCSNALVLGAVAAEVVGAASRLAHGLEQLDGVQGAAEQAEQVARVDVRVCNWKNRRVQIDSLFTKSGF